MGSSIPIVADFSAFILLSATMVDVPALSRRTPSHEMERFLAVKSSCPNKRKCVRSLWRSKLGSCASIFPIMIFQHESIC